MKVFITGSSGLLGNNLVRECLSRGWEVTALARDREKGERCFRGLDLQLVVGDIRDVSAWERHLGGCQLLLHAAAYFREYYQPGSHARALESTNVQGTLGVAEAARRQGIGRVVHVSSGGTVAKSEGTPPLPGALENGYFASKLRADQALDALTDLDLVRVLPGWMMGPWDTAPTSAGQLILDFVNRRLPGRIRGGTTSVDARDVAWATAEMSVRGAPGARYVVGGRYLDLATLMDELEAVSGVPAPRLLLPDPLVDAAALLFEGLARATGRPTPMSRPGLQTLRLGHSLDSSLAESALGVRFRPLRTTLEDCLAWFARHTPAALPRQVQARA